MVLRNSRTRLQCDEHNPQTVVLDKRLGVLARLPPSLAMELLEFARDVEFEVRSGHGRCMRTPASARSIGHRASPVGPRRSDSASRCHSCLSSGCFSASAFKDSCLRQAVEEEMEIQHTRIGPPLLDRPAYALVIQGPRAAEPPSQTLLRPDIVAGEDVQTTKTS